MNCYKDENCHFVLYADDTNLFVVAETKAEVYKKANAVLQRVHQYMTSNLLHINMSKCVYMHFEPKVELKFTCARTQIYLGKTHPSNCIYINNTPIPKVKETRFLGIIIDDKLSWSSHINYLHKKLNASIGIISRIRHSIPKEHHKTIYHSLFESHINYGITVWGGAKNSDIDKIFKVQKRCVRMLFGDYCAYLNKFCTSARTREFGSQVLGNNFFCKEHTKPLFKQNGLLTVQNLYNKFCCTEIFKILKFRTPIAIHNSLNISKRNNNMLLITPTPSSQFMYKGSVLWNKVYKTLLPKYNDDLSITLSSFKNNLYNLLIKNQCNADNIEWVPQNFEL